MNCRVQRKGEAYIKKNKTKSPANQDHSSITACQRRLSSTRRREAGRRSRSDWLPTASTASFLTAFILLVRKKVIDC